MRNNIIIAWIILTVEIVFIMLIKFWSILDVITPSYRNMIFNFGMLFILITIISILALYKKN